MIFRLVIIFFMILFALLLIGVMAFILWLVLVILFSWGIALVEYSFMVPANRIGFEGNGGPFSLVQLKVMQECITLVIFTIFSMIAFKGTHIGWNHILAFLLIVAAVWLVFMDSGK